MLFITLVFFSTCTKDKTQVIDAELLPYVNDFFEKANEFGTKISLEDYNLEVNFSDLDGNTAGTCRIGKDIVKIDKIRWDGKDKDERQWVIFHELGHCILERWHLNLSFPNGECKSIMYDGKGGCSYDFHAHSWKEYYFEELFTKKSVLPTWYNLDFEPLVFDNNQHEMVLDENFVLNEANRVDISIDTFNQLRNFQIELSCFDWEVERYITLYWDEFLFRLYTEEIADFNPSIRVSREEKQLLRKITTKEELPIDFSKTRLTIQKKDNYYYFFVDDKLQFATDFSEVQNADISTHGAEITGMELSLRLFYF